MTVDPEQLILRQSAQINDWFKATHDTIDELLRENPKRSDRWVAWRATQRLPHVTSMPARWVAERRIVIAGATPKTDHGGLIRILALHAWHLGFEACPERSFTTGPRRSVIPDLVVARPDEPIRWIIEVKTSLSTKANISMAARQAERYVEALGAPAIVTSYEQPRVDRVGDILFMKASDVRKTFADEMRRAVAA